MTTDSLQPFSGAALAALALVSLCLTACTETTSPPGDTLTMKYPAAERQEVTDDYFGVEVEDPYRWLEELDSDKTRGWVTAQNALSMPILSDNPRYEEIRRRLEKLWDYEKYGVPYREGGRYFFEKNDGLQAQSVLYVTEFLDGEPRVLVDPNTFSEDGTVSISDYKVSRDGKYLAYSVSDGGSDWDVWRILEIESGRLLPEMIQWTKFTSVSWAADSGGFYYSRYPLDENGQGDDSQQVAVYFHIPGTSQEADRLIFEFDGIPQEETRNPYASVTEDGAYLVLGIWEGYEANGQYIMDLGRPDTPVIRLLDDWDALYHYIGNKGSVFFFQTTNGAARGRVVAIDLEKSDRDSWVEAVPEADATLEDSSYVGGRIVAQYLQDAHAMVKLFETDGQLVGEVELPGLGTVEGFEGHADDPECFYSFESILAPPSIFRFDVATGESQSYRIPSVAFDADAFETHQVFFTSKDGTQVPMFVTHKKGLELDGSNRTLLYGYGGFNVSKTPEYKTAWAVWLEMGGVFAMANLRGGGEYGEEWHLAGTKLQKQNVFDDFIAAAVWLIDNDYTSTPYLAIQGGSNGGLLVGAVMTQRPDLFGAALPAVGVMDMLRYHLPSANARQWSSDYGLSENEDEFHALHAYSPYHRLEPGTCYPPTLVTTADHDDRVVPWHSYKFGAALQHAQSCDNAVLVRVETRAGHGAGKPTWMKIENIADQWSFLDLYLARAE